MEKQSCARPPVLICFFECCYYQLSAILETDFTLNENCEIPKWISKIVLSNEKDDYNELIKVDTQIQNLITRKNRVQLNLNNNFRYKKLLYSSGKELEEIIKNVFNDVGFELLPCRPNRSDINLKYNDDYFVCEVKGLSKSAGEKNSNQLQKWETEFFEDYEIHPKQVLIVNSFRNIPLSERIEDSFPNQMLDYAIKKEQCLITTTQLLCFYLCWLEDKSILEDFVKKIIATNGIFTDYNDWGKNIFEIE